MDSSTLELQLFHRGAEADLFLSALPPWKAVVKRRVRKAYRNEALDTTIRKERTARESSIIRNARSAGARTPSILGLDMEECSIVMTFVSGLLARDLIETMDSLGQLALFEELGRQIGFLHSSGIVHGDLTSSNIIMADNGSPFLIDFGMSSKSSEREDFGTDIHLLQRSLAATHSLNSARPIKAIERGYRRIVGSEVAQSRFKKAAEIARRGRYFALR